MMKMKKVKMRVRDLVVGMWTLALFALLPSTSAAQPVQELLERGASAGVDVELLTELRDRALRAGLEASAAAELLRPAVELAERELPSRAVIQKGLEGLSKAVPHPRIAAVQGRLREGIEQAAGLVDPWLARPGVRDGLAAHVGPETGAGDGVRATVLEGVGIALAQGTPEAALRDLLDRVPLETAQTRVAALEVAVAAEILAELPLATSRPAIAAEVVATALASGFGPAELRELPEAMRTAQRRSDLPAEAVARGAIFGMGEDLPAHAVLQALFEGGLPGNALFDLPPGVERARDRISTPPGDRPD